MCVSCCCVKFTLGSFVVLVAAASQLFQLDYVFAAGIQDGSREGAGSEQV